MRATGAKRCRLVDIAHAAGVSKITVSKVLSGTGGNNTRVSEKTAEKIKKIAIELNYSPNLAARQLSGVKSRLLGVIIDSAAPENIHDSLAIIERYSSENGYRCIVGYSHGESKLVGEYVNDFLGRDVEGVICLSHNYPENGDELARLFKTFENRVFIEPPIGDDSSLYVATDHRKAAFLLTRHLLELGRSRIALLLPGIEYRQMREREEGYREALENSRIQYDDSLIWRSKGAPISNEKDMTEILESILPSSPDAIIAPGDGGAMWLIRILKSRGIAVPEDVSVAGFDLWDISQSFIPSITTVDLRHREVALKAVQLLFESIDNDKQLSSKAGKSTIIQPAMVIGESCVRKPSKLKNNRKEVTVHH